MQRLPCLPRREGWLCRGEIWGTKTFHQGRSIFHSCAGLSIPEYHCSFLIYRWWGGERKIVRPLCWMWGGAVRRIRSEQWILSLMPFFYSLKAYLNKTDSLGFCPLVSINALNIRDPTIKRLSRLFVQKNSIKIRLSGLIKRLRESFHKKSFFKFLNKKKTVIFATQKKVT